MSTYTNTLDNLEKMPLDRQCQLNLLPAEVELTVTEFKDIFHASGVGKTRGTGHQMTMSDEHSRVYIGANDGALHVRPLGATIRIVVSPKRYYPIGIAFELKEGITSPSKLDRLGLLNFEQLRLIPHENALTITDRFLEEEAGNADNEYEFSVIIQDGLTGKIGIIDPPIIHDPR